MFKFAPTKATKEQAKLRLALQGPAGSGKTWSALSIGTHLVPGGRVMLFDSEHGSASKYADAFDFDAQSIVGDYNPRIVREAIRAAADAGYAVVIFDSLTHFWNGPGGFLELVDNEVKRMQQKGGRPDSFAAWKAITPIYNEMVQAILGAPIHVIVTLRAKTEYEKVQGDNGKSQVKKVGMAPEIRDNFQYEMDIEGMLDTEHNLVVGKTRCAAIDSKVYNRPGREFAEALRAWLTSGEAPAPVRPTEPTKREHHPSWGADKGRFFAKLTDIGESYGYVEVANFCERLGRPRPSQMDDAQRGKLLDYLASEKGRADFAAFIADGSIPHSGAAAK